MQFIERLIKNNKFIQILYVSIGSFFVSLLSIFIRQNKQLILFSSFGGKKCNDSPKCLFEEIKKKYGSKFKYIWAITNDCTIKIEGASFVKINSLKYFIVALKAKYWITNVNIERGLRFKKKKCMYLNTWHGIPLDYIGNDRPGRNDYNFKKLTYICVSGSFDEYVYKRAFKCNDKQFLRCGMPRNDCLVNKKYDVLTLKKQLGLPIDRKIILYAPTWRENYSNHHVDGFCSPFNIKKWENKLSKDFVLLFRAHSLSKNILNISFNNFCRDFSNYDDTNKLLSIVDILITDYSSIALDFAILEKPIFNFCYDYDEYLQNHGFYVDYKKEMPNGIFYDEDLLIEAIQSIDYNLQIIKTRKLKNSYLNYTLGKSSVTCLDKLFNK